MGFFDKISSSFGKGKIRKEQTGELRQLIAESIRDGHLSDDEIKQINSFYGTSDLSEENFKQIKNESFQLAVSWAISDRRVSQSEAHSLEQIAHRLEIDENVWNQVSGDLNFYFTLNEIENGKLPQMHPANVILQKGEIGHLVFAAQLIEERVIGKTTVGRSKGVSIRIMQGVSYRVGASKGRIQSEMAMIPVSTGTFAVTNKRLIFSGDKKSFSAEYKKLLDVQLYSDAIQFSLTTRQKPVIVSMPNSRSVELCAATISQIINSE